jgi:hypothetical protein
MAKRKPAKKPTKKKKATKKKAKVGPWQQQLSDTQKATRTCELALLAIALRQTRQGKLVWQWLAGTLLAELSCELALRLSATGQGNNCPKSLEAVLHDAVYTFSISDKHGDLCRVVQRGEQTNAAKLFQEAAAQVRMLRLKDSQIHSRLQAASKQLESHKPQ